MAEASRDGRHRLREALYDVTTDKALSRCGRYALGGGVTPKVTPGGTAYLAGLATCGKVHICPCCGAKIRSARTVELQAAGTAWEDIGGINGPKIRPARAAWKKDINDRTAEDWAAIEEADGLQAGGLGMLTLTMRHYSRHTLAELVTQQRDAWKKALGQNAGRDWRKAKKDYGVVGFVRAWEVTYGEANGWHPHWHVLVFFDKPLTPEQGDALEEVIYEAWSTALQDVGAYLPDREHGVRLDLSGHGEGGPLARYLMKYQDGKAAWTTAAEMTRTDTKAGRDGHRTPFEIARVLLTEDAADDDRAQTVRLWQEYETAARGMRALYWSNGLRKRLAALVELDTRTDGEIAAEERQGEALAVILADPWHQHIARRKGRSLQLLKAAEKGGQDKVRALVESWGLVWGRDVLPPPPVDLEAAEQRAEELLDRRGVEGADRQRKAHRVAKKSAVPAARKASAAAKTKAPKKAAAHCTECGGALDSRLAGASGAGRHIGC